MLRSQRVAVKGARPRGREAVGNDEHSAAAEAPAVACKPEMVRNGLAKVEAGRADPGATCLIIYVMLHEGNHLYG
jgi:hypothetical protein